MQDWQEAKENPFQPTETTPQMEEKWTRESRPYLKLQSVKIEQAEKSSKAHKC